MKRGGARDGAGRKPVPRTRIMIHDETLKELEKIQGKTWNDKIKKLLEHIKN